jgi:NADP-dependent 3-hydroxy acid dehydrogenase YdfG
VGHYALLERRAARVYATARRPEALGDLVARYGERVVPVRLDVTRPSEVRAVAAQAGDVRLLINNAGIVAKFGGELTNADWMTAARDEFEVNMLGALSLTQRFAPLLTGRA